MIRKPFVAGQFYGASRQGLADEIESCFTSKIGPGRLPEKGAPGASYKFKGGVAPHAGFVYSGHEAAHLYLKMYETGLPEAVVIIGPSHRSFSRSKIGVFCGEAFETPLGICRVDRGLAEAIASNAPFGRDEAVHASEHSLEVQVPFLQYIYSAAGAPDSLAIVPLCMVDQDYETSAEAGEAMASALKGCGKRVAVIASSDFSHYVPAAEARARDMKAIDEILRLEMPGMYRNIDKYDISMCGYGPISATVGALARLGRVKAELLKYGTSGDVARMPEVVGYAAISFMEE